MVLYLLSCIYFFFPAYVANAMPPLVSKINILNKPIDNNKIFMGAPLLGNHKTWRGLASEIIIGTPLFAIMFCAHKYFDLTAYQTIGINDYTQINPFLLGFLLSLGIIFGDLLFAFIKRRLKLRPGARFIPFDQTNYVIGSFIFVQPLLHLELKFWLCLLVLTFFIHVLFNRIGYKLGLHNAKW